MQQFNRKKIVTEMLDFYEADFDLKLEFAFMTDLEILTYYKIFYESKRKQTSN